MKDTYETKALDMEIELNRVTSDIQGVIDGFMKELVNPESFVLLKDSGVIAIRNTIELLMDASKCLGSIAANAADVEERLAELEDRVLKLELETGIKIKKE